MTAVSQMEKAYNPTAHEDAIYAKWEESGAFTPTNDPDKEPFVISMPPPNVTGTLHLGHAMSNVYEDLMIRYQRMRGRDCLFLPGTDHAGIATQNVVEKHLLKEEGKTRHDLGREAFLKRVWEWKERSHGIITKQIRKLGTSCDWTRERFTLDQGLSEAVREAFVRLYEDGLIYRGERIINWCVRCGSAISDIEVTFEEKNGTLYHINYKAEDGTTITVATTRPETMLGDTAVCVHPEDERYKDLIGKTVTLPIVGRKLPIIADEMADPEFGSGAVKITPAHDPFDAEAGDRHNLEFIQVIGQDGKMTDRAGADFQGLTAKECRVKIIQILEESGELIKSEDLKHNVSTCSRCKDTIEPLISEQWFVKTKPLAEKAINVVRDGQIKIIPERFNKTYFNWMENIRDWCISRQLWWGHRIPVWYCDDCHKMTVAKIDPDTCHHCQSSNLRQDEDTLDTWFSSGLWTFSTLGWPEKTEDLKRFHPSNVLETGYDIIFFWVARMIMLSTYLLDEIPFDTVYLHGLARDRQGRKMSKSLGNGIDPLEVIEKHGCDALRLSLVIGTTPGNDIKIFDEKISGYRNFVNKLWNTARYIQGLDQTNNRTEHSLCDKWIQTRTQEVIKEVTHKYDTYQFSEAGNTVYNFLWHEFCDWYLEMSKIEGPNITLLKDTLLIICKLIHPIAPFITEVIYQELDLGEGLLMKADWDLPNENLIDKDAKQAIDRSIDCITTIRRITNTFNLDPSTLSPKTDLAALPHIETIKSVFLGLAKIEEIQDTAGEAPQNHLLALSKLGGSVYIKIPENFDKAGHTEKLEKTRKKTEGFIQGLEKKLSDPKFIENAPKELQEGEAIKLKEAKSQMQELQSQLESLK